jgi:hypothetical protein
VFAPYRRDGRFRSVLDKLSGFAAGSLGQVLPPRCELCGRKAGHGGRRPFDGYSLVQFADHEPQESGGLSPGLSWFCPHHAEAARTVAELPRETAMARLRSDYAAGRLKRRRRGWLRRRA